MSRVIFGVFMLIDNKATVTKRNLAYWQKAREKLILFSTSFCIHFVFALVVVVGVEAEDAPVDEAPVKILDFIKYCKDAAPQSIKAVKEQIRYVKSPRFRATPQQRRELVKQLEGVVEELEDGSTLPVLRIPLSRAQVGNIGFFTDGNPNQPATVEVFQVIDGDSLLCRHAGRLFWMEVPTKTLIDGSFLHLNDVLEVSGTQTYQTAAGGSKTVYRLEKFDIEAAKFWFNKLREK